MTLETSYDLSLLYDGLEPTNQLSLSPSFGDGLNTQLFKLPNPYKFNSIDIDGISEDSPVEEEEYGDIFRAKKTDGHEEYLEPIFPEAKTIEYKPTVPPVPFVPDIEHTKVRQPFIAKNNTDSNVIKPYVSEENFKAGTVFNEVHNAEKPTSEPPFFSVPEGKHNEAFSGQVTQNRSVLFNETIKPDESKIVDINIPEYDNIVSIPIEGQKLEVDSESLVSKTYYSETIDLPSEIDLPELEANVPVVNDSNNYPAAPIESKENKYKQESPVIDNQDYYQEKRIDPVVLNTDATYVNAHDEFNYEKLKVVPSDLASESQNIELPESTDSVDTKNTVLPDVLINNNKIAIPQSVEYQDVQIKANDFLSSTEPELKPESLNYNDIDVITPDDHITSNSSVSPSVEDNQEPVIYPIPISSKGENSYLDPKIGTLKSGIVNIASDDTEQYNVDIPDLENNNEYYRSNINPNAEIYEINNQNIAENQTIYQDIRPTAFDYKTNSVRPLTSDTYETNGWNEIPDEDFPEMSSGDIGFIQEGIDFVSQEIFKEHH